LLRAGSSENFPAPELPDIVDFSKSAGTFFKKCHYSQVGCFLQTVVSGGFVGVPINHGIRKSQAIPRTTIAYE
jgi:hypothetical protein